MKLHWLPVRFRPIVKTLWHIIKVVKGVLPSYLDDLICEHIHVLSRFLRSFDAILLFVLCTFSKFGNRIFNVCGFLL